MFRIRASFRHISKETFMNRTPVLSMLALATALALSPASAFTAQPQGHGNAHGAAKGGTARVALYENLGMHRYRITTSVPLAQRYFDQGLRLYYAFNHQEAIRAFEEAARLDPQCAMCSWGIALALGPNINAPMEEDAARPAYAASQKALKLAKNASPRERALIDALAKRYAAVPSKDRAPLDQAYAAAMREVVRAHGDDLEARTLLAESLMDLSPWEYWTRDGKPREHTRELLAQLELVMAAQPNHPGANHFYIHAVEAVAPERAVPAAERLAKLMPGAGHLVHMPGHIYVRVGRYADAIKANEHAVLADETYIRDQKPAFGVYVAGYYPHNYDFLAFAASMIGRSAQAIGTAEKMAALASKEMLKTPGLTFTQHHHTRHLQMKVRFGRWDDILGAPAPGADLPHATAMWQYARGRALAAKGDVRGAEVQLERVRAASRNEALTGLRLEFNTVGTVLGIAGEVLAGHIAAAKGDFPGAIKQLREAARREDDMTYGEPPEWSVPVRQELGQVLLKAGRAAAAERAFREDLKRFPDNGWSLHGLEQALRVQKRTAEANEVASRLKRIWTGSDVAPGLASVAFR
jgi:tetratricopeptide (TPR) repeat protein